LRSLIALAFAVVFLAAAAATPAAAGQVTHTVVPGDTLWSIASRYHVSVATLESRNRLTDQSILGLGQTIVISDVAGPAARHASANPRGTHSAVKTRTVSMRARNHAHSAAPRTPAASPTAASNAVWVATHTGQAPAPPASESLSLAEQILAFDEKVTHTALRYIGVPYVWGGTSYSGVDCSGFVQVVFEHNGITIPRTADSQFEVGRAVRMRDLLPGDLVFFETYAAGASHVGIYLGNGRFVHASSSYGVRVDALAEDYFASRYIGARRIH
jgi:cell wall-associated NlpC family hydrolase